ncbi:uncharacterized protein LOC111156083 [Enhydra lutris kenyoni]|uniref:Uncharacterized protein LOC111156083 n=1 Tax=Enhydra lutris kenyoni TaxID=391180 RepID=A0A2Y9KGX8_ENHLU|nr:uncharacterized protein LOC111156083 [Enhydra lutris kenyoni]
MEWILFFLIWCPRTWPNEFAGAGFPAAVSAASWCPTAQPAPRRDRPHLAPGFRVSSLEASPPAVQVRVPHTSVLSTSTFSVLLHARAGPHAGAALVVSVAAARACAGARAASTAPTACCPVRRRGWPDLTLPLGTHSARASRHTPFALLKLTVTGFVAHAGSGLEDARGRADPSTGGFRGRARALRLRRPGSRVLQAVCRSGRTSASVS